MWALGVVLFTMLYGQFPFYDSVPQELFRKIKAAEFTIPRFNKRISLFLLDNNYIKNCLLNQRWACLGEHDKACASFTESESSSKT